MKKRAAFGLAVMLSVPGVSTVALADGVIEEEEIVEGIENEEQVDGPVLEEEIEFELIDSLSLERALELAMEDNLSLLLLNYQIELIDTQGGSTDKDLRDTNFDVRDLERTRDKLKKSGGNTFQERLAIQNQLEALDAKIKAVEDARKQIESGKVSLAYSEEEAKENIKMAVTATYMQLLMGTEQQGLQQKALELKEKEVAMKKRQYEIGILSRDEHSKELREIERQQTQLTIDKKAWDKNLAEFALDLGIAYHADLKLQPLDLSELTLVEQETDTDELIEKSFKYKGQVEAIALAEYKRDRVYDDKDSDKYDKNQADLNVKIEKDKLEQLKLDAAASIRQLYYDVEDGYQAILDAERELKFAQEDDKSLQRRYALGLVSRANYELASIRIDQAALTLDLAKDAYFLAVQKVNLLEAGVIH